MTNNEIQVESIPMEQASPEPRVRQYSRAYAGFKASILALAGRYSTGSLRDAIRGHSAFVSAQNLHESYIPQCRTISKDSNGRILWSTPLGEFWTPAGASTKYIAGIVAEQAVDTYAHTSLPAYTGEVILDCGGNVGVFTRHAIKRGAQRVIVFEPSTENALCLRRNLEAEIRDGKVTLIEKALGDQATEGWLDTSNRGNPGSWRISGSSPNSHGQSVPMTTLDREVGDLGLTALHRIKIDVEGLEMQVVKGARSTLAQYVPNFAVAVEHPGEDAAQFASAMQSDPWIKSHYQFHCGFHSYDGTRRLRPQILYFVRR